MPRAGSPYGHRYEQERAALLASDPPCHLCGRPAASSDHVPALSLHHHVEGSGCCELRPACRRCQLRQGGRLAHARNRRPLPAPSRAW